jgi:hypothetical protein
LRRVYAAIENAERAMYCNLDVNPVRALAH